MYQGRQPVDFFLDDDNLTRKTTAKQNTTKNKGNANGTVSRKFGTDLSNCNLDNNKKRKRTFNQLESENSKQLYGQPIKRCRYNLRSSSKKHNAAKQIEDCSTNLANAKPATKLQNQPEVNRGLKKRRRRRIMDPTTVQPVRRSARLKKRASELAAIEETRIQELHMEAVAEAEAKEEQQLVQEIESRIVKAGSIDGCDLRRCSDETYNIAYVKYIMQFYYATEDETRACIASDYMAQQADLRTSMRLKLLDWLVDIHRKFRLQANTLYLSIYILDTYLSRAPLHRSRLQLCGCAAMWIASKYHEVYAPQANDFVYMSDSAFTSGELFQMESAVLVELSFNLSKITPLSFTERYIELLTYPLYKKYEQRGTEEATQSCKFYTELVDSLVRCICEYALFDPNLLSNYKSSRIACAALCFACLSIGLYPEWPAFLAEKTGYQVEALKPVIRRLLELRNDRRIKSIDKKYHNIAQWLHRLDVDKLRNAVGLE